MSRRMEIAVLSVVLACSLLGCRKGKQEPGEANETTSQQIKETAEEGLQATTEFLAQQKDNLLQVSKAQLDRLEQQFNGWRGETGIEDEQAKQKLSALGENFERALGEGRGALDKAGQAGADTWEEIKPAVEAGVRKTQEAYQAFVSFVKSQALEIRQGQEAQAGQQTLEE